MKSKKYEITIKAQNCSFIQETITKAEDAQNYARNFYNEDLVLFESVFVILLNKAHKTIGWAKISQGGTCGSVVDGKIVCKYAIDTFAFAVILVHNHPSGNKKPSKEDINITNTIQKQLSFFDIHLLDHIILTESDYYSFSDDNQLTTKK